MTSKQGQLISGSRRWRKKVGPERWQVIGQPQLPTCDSEPMADEIRKRTLPSEPSTPFGIIILPAMEVFDAAHDPFGALGKVGFKPLAEKLRNLERKSQHDPACGNGTGLGRGGQDVFQFVVG